MIQITDMKREERIPVLFRLGFRPFFLFGVMFGLVAMVLWAVALQGQWAFNPYGGSYWWHSHEMLFGFVSAIIVGFLLTAVQNWTGIPGLRGGKLMVLFGLWLSARVLLLLPDLGINGLVAVVDIAFMPLAAYFMAQPLWAVKQKRNMFFVPVLTLFAIANGLTHYAVLAQDLSFFTYGINGTIFLVSLVMVIVGGRVMPMFTANGTNTPKVQPLVWLDKVSIGSVIVLVAVHLFGLNQMIAPELMAGIFMIAGVSNLWRVGRWRIWVTFKVPLVWSLHFAYFCIALAFILLGLSFISAVIQWPTAVHLMTVGGMSGLILAMISRVSLGHTGRLLQVSPLMAVAFACINLAALVRVAGVMLFTDHSTNMVLLSVVLWVTAFALFIGYYWPVLNQPRVDGRPG